jgi:hypothetical protein
LVQVEVAAGAFCHLDGAARVGLRLVLLRRTLRLRLGLGLVRLLLVRLRVMGLRLGVLGL